MAKRKQSSNDSGSEPESDASDVSLIDVDFDFFDPNPAVDYQALKRLLGQLFQSDAEFFHLHELTELILSQPTVGTTVKTNGIESDPYAVLTALNMHVHQTHPSIKSIANYTLEKTATSNPSFHATLQSLFSNPHTHVGLVLCERLINMPVQVVPPMYNMLTNEVKWAVDDGEPYRFTHLLFISRTYHLTPDEESAFFNSAPVHHSKKAPSSKKKRSNAPSSTAGGAQSIPTPAPDGIYPFHPEDEYIKQLSMHTHDYKFTCVPPEPREKDAFGPDTRGRMILLAADRFSELVAKMGEAYAPPT